MENNELYHYGVPGMKWGKRKASYVTVRQANINAKRAASAARKESFARDKANLSGVGSGRKALNNANQAAKAASKSSIAKDKAYNKSLRNKSKSAGDGNVAKAKAAYKAAYKQYSKDFNKSSTLLGAWGPGNKERHAKTYESAIKANKALEAYKKAKSDNKAAKKAQKKADKAAKKLSQQKVKDLYEKYGKLEDSMTYGKNANESKNKKIEKQMESIESQIERERKRFKK